MYPAPGQIGCGYTGRTGGPIRIDTPTAICACEGAGAASIATAMKRNTNNFQLRMAITFPVLHFSYVTFGLVRRFHPRRVLPH